MGADGTPHVVPVGWIYNAARDTIDVGGSELERSKKFGDVARTGRAAIVIDDLESTDPWRPRGIEVRGRAEAITMPTPLIQIYPERIVSWGWGRVAARELWPASSSDHASHGRFGHRRRLRRNRTSHGRVPFRFAPPEVGGSFGDPAIAGSAAKDTRSGAPRTRSTVSVQRQESGWRRRKRGRWKAQDRRPGLHRVI